MEGIFYHGSPIKDLKFLRSGSWVSSDREIAYQMGRYYTSTGKTWKDSDLAEPYCFIGVPKFREGRDPDGIPTVYKVVNPELDLLDNPYEHRIIGEYPVTVDVELGI